MSLERFYDAQYSEGEDAFGFGKPEEVVRDVLKFKSSGSVFELGVGEGRNALFLAENGFDVTARDLSKVGIDKVNKRAGERGLSVRAEVGDITTLEFDRNFDVFVSTYVFQHLSKEEAAQLINRIQKHTNPEGLNVITAFMGKGDFYSDDPEDPFSTNFYPKEEELRKLYDGWEILEYEEVEVGTAEQKEDGTPKINFAAKIIARKKV